MGLKVDNVLKLANLFESKIKKIAQAKSVENIMTEWVAANKQNISALFQEKMQNTIASQSYDFFIKVKLTRSNEDITNVRFMVTGSLMGSAFENKKLVEISNTEKNNLEEALNSTYAIPLLTLLKPAGATDRTKLELVIDRKKDLTKTNEVLQ